MDIDDLSPEQEFAVRINLAMKRAIEDDADLQQVAKVCLNTSRELYDHYGVGEDYNQYMEFVVDAGFEAAEVEEWLDMVEGRPWNQDEND